MASLNRKSISVWFFNGFIRSCANVLCIFAAGTLLSGCFTGIESTKKITLSKDDIKAAMPTPEDLFLSSVKPELMSNWSFRKPFLVVGERGGRLFEPRRIESGDCMLHEGDTLFFLTSRRVILPDGSASESIEFLRGKDEFRYIPTNIKDDKEIQSDEIPGLVDPRMLDKIGSLMIGKDFWTQSPLWENETGGKVEGLRFEKVHVNGIEGGNMIFPVKVKFTDSKGENACMLMNFGNSSKDSRAFSNLFQLSDPRQEHPSISDEFWKCIQAGNVDFGMTKDECWMAKGNPEDVNIGKDYQHTMLVWTYKDGTILYFIDNILRGINSPPKYDR